MLYVHKLFITKMMILILKCQHLQIDNLHLNNDAGIHADYYFFK